jgi:hypothetical protein
MRRDELERLGPKAVRVLVDTGFLKEQAEKARRHREERRRRARETYKRLRKTR